MKVFAEQPDHWKRVLCLRCRTMKRIGRCCPTCFRPKGERP